MELALSLGNRPGAAEDNTTNTATATTVRHSVTSFCMGFSSVRVPTSTADDHHKADDPDQQMGLERAGSSSSSDPPPPLSPPQLHLHLFSPVPRPSSSAHPPPPLRLPWLPDNLSSEPGSSDGGPGSRVMEVNRRPVVGATAEEGEEQCSPNSGTSSFMEFSLYTGGVKRKESGGGGGGDMKGGSGGGEMERGGTTSRGSDDDENGSTRKKLRLTKEQSAFLEESFKEHHTLNPKQKLALAKQLELRPRQVEVWFQNRRARTKLKQTEVDCEYLKRCCETLTEENRRLQKELQDLRALKTSQPFFMQLPATTLTMCPSCERVAPTSSSPAPATISAPASKPDIATTSAAAAASGSAITLALDKPKPKPMLPFSNAQAHKAAS